MKNPFKYGKIYFVSYDGDDPFLAMLDGGSTETHACLRSPILPAAWDGARDHWARIPLDKIKILGELTLTTPAKGSE